MSYMSNYLSKFINFLSYEDNNEFIRYLKLRRQTQGTIPTLILSGPACSGKTFVKSMLNEHRYELRLSDLHNNYLPICIVTSDKRIYGEPDNPNCVVVNLCKIGNPRFEIVEEFEQALDKIAMETGLAEVFGIR